MSRYPDNDLSAPVGDWIMNTVRRNPEGLLVLAAGCALLMRGGKTKTSSSGTNAYRDYGEAAVRRPGSRHRSGLGDSISDAADYVSDVKDRVADTATSYASTVSEYASQAGQDISDRSVRLKQQAQSTLQTGMDRMLREQPLTVAILGVAAGAAVAAVFPTTDVEGQALGGAREALAAAANKVGENVMGAAGAAGERLKSVAAERGLTQEGLKEMARDVADTFSTAVAGTVQPEAASGSNTKSGQATIGRNTAGNVTGKGLPNDRGNR
jgi:hypothetical protein